MEVKHVFFELNLLEDMSFILYTFHFPTDILTTSASNDKLRRMESVYAVYVKHHRTLRISVASNIQSEVSKKSISKNRAKGI